MLRIVLEAVGGITGSVALAALLCWLCWNCFKIIRHPEWGTPVALMIIAAACGAAVLRSEFLSLAFIFSALAAAICWSEGHAWRKRRPEHREDQAIRLAPPK